MRPNVEHSTVVSLVRGGLSLAMTAHAYAFLDSYLYGFALQEASLPATGGTDMADLAGALIEPLPDGVFAHLTEFTTQHVLQPGYDFRAEFAFGLDLILDGLESWVPRSERTRPERPGS